MKQFKNKFKVIAFALILINNSFAGEFALSANLFNSTGGKLGYYSKGQNKGFYNGAAIGFNLVELKPVYRSTYLGLGNVTQTVNALEYAFGWELGYQTRVKEINRFRGGIIASFNMLDGTDPSDYYTLEQLEYNRDLIIKLTPILTYSIFPFKSTSKDYLGLSFGFETPIIVSTLENAFPGLHRVQFKVFSAICY